MGRRGPPPKPTALRLIDGGAGHRPVNMHEPVPAGQPEPPEWLDPEARKVWDQLVPRLSTTGLARSIDAGVLARYCTMFVLWVRAAEFIRKNGSTYPVRAEPKTPRGQGRILGFREFPQAAEMRKLDKQLLAIEREFGQTPASRTRIRLENEKGAAKDINELKRRMFGA